jgi:hypothetical protein
MMNEETDPVAKKADIIKKISKATEGENIAQRKHKSTAEKADNFEESQKIYNI